MPSCGVCPSVCSSVCLPVTFVDSVKTNKHKRYGNIPTPSPLPPVTEVSNVGWVGNNRDSRREYLAIASMTGGVRTITATVDRAVYGTDRHASVNLIYHSQQGRPGRREQNRTEFNCTQQSHNPWL